MAGLSNVGHGTQDSTGNREVQNTIQSLDFKTKHAPKGDTQKKETPIFNKNTKTTQRKERKTASI